MVKGTEKTADDFEKKIDELKAIVERLEGDASLEESIALFESGLELTKACIDDLNRTQARIAKLKGKLDIITAQTGFGDGDE